MVLNDVIKLLFFWKKKIICVQIFVILICDYVALVLESNLYYKLVYR